MNAWLTQHMQALKLVVRRFKANKLNTLLIFLAIGVALALPSILYAVLGSVSGMANTVKSESQISLFLTLGHQDNTVQAIKMELESNADIKKFNFVSKEDALSQLQAADSKNDVLNSLQQNPLPDAFFIEPKQLDAKSIDKLKSNLSKLEGVEEVLVDGAWVKRLNYLLALGKKAMLIITGLLVFALVAVIGNTIRMQIVTQQAEIELSRLIGATKGFIRRPFLYAGALYALFGGILALAITAAVIALFNQSLAPLATEYQTTFSLIIPSFSTSVVICVLALLIGIASAYLAVSKSLSQALR